MADAGPVGFSVEKGFYSVLKLHVYATLHDTFIRSLSGMNGSAIAEARPTFGRFTARKTNNLFVPTDGSGLACSADFYGFTSHKVREKLEALGTRGVLVLEGRGLRDAYIYRWSVPVSRSDLASFIILKNATKDDLSMNLELARIHAARGFEPFNFRDFLQVYESAHLQEYSHSRWGSRKFDELRNSSDYERFLKARLLKLASSGLLDLQSGVFRLAPAAKDAVDHFTLFAEGIAYHPSQELCSKYPLIASLSRGRLDPLIASINGRA